MIEVRLPTKEEIKPVAEFLIEQFYPNIIYAKLAPCNMEDAIKLGETSLAQKLFIVAFEDDKVIGAILGLHAPYVFNHNMLIASEVLFFVDPAHRQSKLGAILIRKFEYACLMADVTVVSLMNLETHDADLVAQFYNKLGYSKQESTFIKVIV